MTKHSLVLSLLRSDNAEYLPSTAAIWERRNTHWTHCQPSPLQTIVSMP
jgi:hypothetical protein